MVVLHIVLVVLWSVTLGVYALTDIKAPKYLYLLWLVLILVDSVFELAEYIV